MLENEIEDQDQWPLEGIRVATVIKVDRCEVYHHTNENPYYQISVGGFVLDSFGDAVLANIEFNVDEGDTEAVSRFEKNYAIGSLHWIDTAKFGLLGGAFQFYSPNTTPITREKYEAINYFFSSRIERDQQPEVRIINPPELSEIDSLCHTVDVGNVMICCVVTSIKETNTKRGDTMCFATVEDSTGSAEITVFSDIYHEVKDLLNSQKALCIAGKLDISENRIRILVDKTLGFIRANTAEKYME